MQQLPPHLHCNPLNIWPMDYFSADIHYTCAVYWLNPLFVNFMKDAGGVEAIKMLQVEGGTEQPLMDFKW